MEKFADLIKTVSLRPHQENAIQKYLNNDNKQILAHSLGSGKTITSLGAIEKSNSKSALILTPASLQKNYKDSIEKYVTPNARNKYTVMSYEKFRTRPLDFIKEIKPDTLVIDEYHRQKDPRGVSYKALVQARPYVKNFLGLTGTVMQNHPEEIFPLVNLAKGDTDKPIMSRKEFENKYTEVKKVYPKNIIQNLISRLSNRYGEKRVLKNTGNLGKELNSLVDKNAPTPEFLKEFPKKEFVDIETPMTPQQQRIYNYFMKKDLNWLDRWRVKHDLPPNAKNSDKMFAKLIRARQVSDTPTVLSKELQNADPITNSGKLSVAYKNLLDHIKSNKKHKAMVYSNFTESGINPIANALKKKNISFGEFSGRVTRRSRNKDIEEFNAGKKRILLASPAGAEGLDLKGVTLLQNLDPHWNPAKMDQIYGRAARFKSHEALPSGLKKVRIERYQSTIKPNLLKRFLGKKSERSIDQYIYHRSKEKQDLVDQVSELI